MPKNSQLPTSNSQGGPLKQKRPAALERGGRLPMTSGGAMLLFAVFLAGLLSSVMATRAALSTPLLEALRSE